MDANNTLFFDEGAGFTFIEALGVGNNGRADLVRSAYDGRLYVRKQLTTAYPVERETYDRPQREIKMATRLRDLEGVAQLQAWFIYADKARDHIRGDVATFEVTYWDYCGNAGTLHSIIQEAKRRDISIPELWICSWLIQGIAILMDLHDAGYAHRDAHGGNWFLHRTNGNAPRVTLGDFDDVTRRSSTRNTRETQKMFQSDYKKLAHALIQALSYADLPRNGPLSALLTVMSRWANSSPKEGFTIDQRMDILRDQAKDLRRQLSAPTSIQMFLAWPRDSNVVAESVSYQRLHTWSPFVQRYMPILSDPGFEIVASEGWSAPFIRG